jgi:hypothetical protein
MDARSGELKKKLLLWKWTFGVDQQENELDEIIREKYI